MLEFWIDLESLYRKPVFASGKHFVFYCGLNWRAIPATYTAQQMGLENYRYMLGGFTGWSEADGRIEHVRNRDDAV